jgi:hypothetical protein
MLESQAQPSSEAQLAVLLGELLDDGAGNTGGTVAGEVPPEVVELRDMARLLRASSLSVPLPEGRHAVRRALLATAEKSYFEGTPARAAWRRTGRWLGMAAVMALIVGAFGLGAGLLDSFGSPSSPLYGLRHAIDRARAALVPGQTPGTGSPAASARTAEIQEMATSGYVPASVTGYPLTYRFAAHTIPTVPGEMATVEGTIGGLPATLVLRTSAGCSQGQPCGVFMAWVTPLEGTRASAEFGQMSGTFACAGDECKLTLVSKTGVFSKLTASVLTVSGKTASTGLLGTAFTSLGDWVSSVEQAAAALKAEGVLPAGVSVADLVSDAASNQRDRDPKRSPQGTSGSSSTKSGSSSTSKSAGSGSASVGPVIYGIQRGSTGAGAGLEGGGGTSVGFSLGGTSVSVGGTVSVSGSGSTSSVSASGAVTETTSAGSASGTANVGISADNGSIGVASAIGATLGSTSTSGRTGGVGNASGSGAPVSGGGVVGGAPSSGGGLGGLGGGLGGLGGGLGGLGGILH